MTAASVRSIIMAWTVVSHRVQGAESGDWMWLVSFSHVMARSYGCSVSTSQRSCTISQSNYYPFTTCRLPFLAVSPVFSYLVLFSHSLWWHPTGTALINYTVLTFTKIWHSPSIQKLIDADCYCERQAQRPSSEDFSEHLKLLNLKDLICDTTKPEGPYL